MPGSVSIPRRVSLGLYGSVPRPVNETGCGTREARIWCCAVPDELGSGSCFALSRPSLDSGAKALLNSDWCRWPDSNRHTRRHCPLKTACLPIPPHRRACDLGPPRSALAPASPYLVHPWTRPQAGFIHCVFCPSGLLGRSGTSDPPVVGTEPSAGRSGTSVTKVPGAGTGSVDVGTSVLTPKRSVTLARSTD